MITDTEQLFIHTLDDLGDRGASGDAYVVLGASALLRKLLLDSHPLIDQVNRAHQVKITFEIGKNLVPANVSESTLCFAVQDNLDPNTAAPWVGRTTVSRDGFLSTTVLFAGAHSYSVKDMILFEAHIMGGVHAGTPKEDKEKALSEIANRFQFGGARLSLRQLRAIIRVTLSALKPLREAVEK